MSATQVFEPLICADALTGAEIAFDVAGCVEKALARSGPSSGYAAFSGYTAKISIELQAHDVDDTKISETVLIGKLDPALPANYTAIEIANASPPEVRERAVDGSTPSAPERRKRTYVRSRTQSVVTK
jgi:hypothetical protein